MGPRLCLCKFVTNHILKAGIYDFLHVFICNILIKYVTITQNRQEKVCIKAEFHKMQQRHQEPQGHAADLSET
jgi:hypothetical protein